MKNQNGYSLTEVILSIGLLSVFLFFISTLTGNLWKNTSKSTDSLNQSSDFSVIFTWLQRNSFKRHLSINGFTGTALSGVGRAIVPFQNKCADLTTACPNDTALFLATVDLKKTPFVTAICALDANRIIVDLGYEYFGTPSLLPDGINVSAINSLFGGKITIVNNALLLTMDDPNANLFIATGTPKAFNPLYNAATDLYGEPSFAANPTCISLVKDRTKLVVIDIKPYLLPTTGSVNPPAALALSAMGEFPIKLTQPKMVSVGRNPTSPTQWGIRFCDDLYPNPCNKPATLELRQVGAVNIFEYFKLGLGANAFNIRYSLGKPSACKDTSCKNLNIPAVVKFFGPGEEPDILEATQFSFLKQNYLDRIQFELEDRSGGKIIPRRYYVEGL